MQQKPIILVTGATGAQGGSVANSLIEGGKYNVRCLTRNAASAAAIKLHQAGAEIIEGSMDDINFLKDAMKDCYGVFGVTSFWEHFEKEYQHGINLVDAAHQSRIQHYIHSTLPCYKDLSDGQFEVPHCDIKARHQEYALSLGLNATFVHIAFYYENFLNFFPPQNGEDETYQFGFPQGDTNLSMVSVEDMGGVIETVLNNPREYIGRVVGIVAEDDNCHKYAETMTEVFGEKVIYNYIPREVYASFGFPGAGELANMFEVQRLYVPDRKAAMAESKRLFPAIQSFKSWLKKNKSKFGFIVNEKEAVTF